MRGWKIKPGFRIMQNRVIHNAGDVLEKVEDELKHMVEWVNEADETQKEPQADSLEIPDPVQNNDTQDSQNNENPTERKKPGRKPKN
jgi:hypothetical protein